LKEIDVFNNGEMLRDFTYVDDIVEGIIDNPPKPNPNWNHETSSAPYKVYNNPVKLMDFIEAIENKLGKKIEKNFMPLQAGDVPATFANVNDLDINQKHQYKKFVDWYLEFFGYNKYRNNIFKRYFK